MLIRSIPITGEAIPVVGLGTWRGFDVGNGEADRGPRRAVIERLFESGGTVIDTSPRYGRAEEVTGDLLEGMAARESCFLATKIRISGRQAGIEQMERSFAYLRTTRIDLMQIHNLVDWRTHLATLRQWRDEGRFRYIGITHYLRDALPELIGIVRIEKLDFVQFAYSLALPDAADELLPLCADNGVAVMVNRPFDSGAMFGAVRGRDLPPWAGEFGIASWGQFFLKFTLAHPAVTCVIPGTGNPERAAEDFAAGAGRIPDATEARRMLDFWRDL